MAPVEQLRQFVSDRQLVEQFVLFLEFEFQRETLQETSAYAASSSWLNSG
jgi:hypothetical protein